MCYPILKKAIPFLFFSFVTTLANAQSSEQKAYMVQIGAYKNVSETVLAQLEPYGSIKTEVYNSITRVSIDKIGSMREAKSLLSQLQNEGFSDAFIKNSTSSGSYSALAKDTNDSINLSKITELEALSPEERSLAVYLDGKLHLKRGNEFIPVK